MNREEKIQHLREKGYPIVHLFGDWYWGRIYSKNYKKFSLWWFHHFKEFNIQIEETPIKPQGEYKLNK